MLIYVGELRCIVVFEERGHDGDGKKVECRIAEIPLPETAIESLLPCVSNCALWCQMLRETLEDGAVSIAHGRPPHSRQLFAILWGALYVGHYML